MLTIGAPPNGLPLIDESKLSTSVNRKILDQKHVEWDLNKDTYFNVAVMFEGGSLIRKHADKFLPRRPKEDSGVYQHRLELMTYENNLGTAIGWWLAEMFSSMPKIDIKPTRKDGNPDSDGELQPDQDKFYHQAFFKDCDRHGTPFVDFAREIFKNLVLYRKCYVLVDQPQHDPDKYLTFADQQAEGALNPYLCSFAPSQVINWDVDEHGNYNWVLIYQKTVTSDFLKGPRIVERWYYYDRQTYKVYECEYEEKAAQSEDNQIATLVSAGYHALANKNVVPIQCIEFPEAWWLANRAYLPAMEHIDEVNVLRWSLRMAGLAVPVVFTDDEVTNTTVSEYMFLKFGKEDRYEWTEPPGRVWEHLADRIQVLTEEIWRAMYLVAQARSTSATAGAASGAAKQQDMTPSHDVLGGMGGILRTALQNVLTMVMWARGDEDLSPDVTGFTFEDKLTAAELDVIEEVLSLGIPSETFEKEVYKLAVRLVLKHVNEDRLTEIFGQIDAGPTRDEREQQQMQQKFDMVRSNIKAAASDKTTEMESD